MSTLFFWEWEMGSGKWDLGFFEIDYGFDEIEKNVKI